MHKLYPFVVAGLLTMAFGCRTKDSHPPWEAFTKSHLDAYKHVFVACIYEDHWEDKGPGRLAPHHFKATVVKTFKGDWKFSERVAFVHYVDARASAIANEHAGSHVFVFTNEHTGTEITLDTGDFGVCDADLEHTLQLVYPQRDGR
jgi:hypothetical protein